MSETAVEHTVITRPSSLHLSSSIPDPFLPPNTRLASSCLRRLDPKLLFMQVQVLPVWKLWCKCKQCVAAQLLYPAVAVRVICLLSHWSSKHKRRFFLGVFGFVGIAVFVFVKIVFVAFIFTFRYFQLLNWHQALQQIQESSQKKAPKITKK